ncbi:MAG: hypothetical protein EAX86_12830 [Candidatus Heimdallarchaeota archaeon]|nr:hypothetical protein [Candidatus Heimdallarchaeota archaeon]
MDESELRALIRQYAIEAKLDQGEASLTAVLKRLLAENPDLQTQIRSSIPLVKEEINNANIMDDDELEEFGGVDVDTDESSEYETLETLVVQRIQEADELKGNVIALIIYGSYAKRLHVVGESDINFVVILSSKASEAVIEAAIAKINHIAEELVTPEVAHIFDLMILKEEDLNNLIENFGPVFTYIHILYAQSGELKLGENIFTKIKVTDEQIRESAKLLILESIAQIDEIIRAAQEEGEENGEEEALPEDELNFLIGPLIIDITFALACYNVGTKASSLDLVKPDIHLDEIRQVYDPEGHFKDYYTVFEQAHAFKLGIKYPDSQNFLEKSFEYIKKVVEYTGLQEPSK